MQHNDNFFAGIGLIEGSLFQGAGSLTVARQPLDMMPVESDQSDDILGSSSDQRNGAGGTNQVNDFFANALGGAPVEDELPGFGDG